MTLNELNIIAEEVYFKQYPDEDIFYALENGVFFKKEAVDSAKVAQSQLSLKLFKIEKKMVVEDAIKPKKRK